MDLAAFARKTIENHCFFNGFATKTREFHGFLLVLRGKPLKFMPNHSKTISKPYQNHTKTIRFWYGLGMVLVWFSTPGP